MIHDELSDKYLVEQYVAGDKSMLPILVKRWHKIFCQKAFWILRDIDLSKDVAQECWLIIIDKISTLKKAESFKTWALRIVYHKAIDTHKRRLKQVMDMDRVERNVAIESEENDHRSILKKKLATGIQSLSGDSQDIIRLFYLEEYSLKEISSFLQIPIGTAKSRLFKARETLKLIIK